MGFYAEKPSTRPQKAFAETENSIELYPSSPPLSPSVSTSKRSLTQPTQSCRRRKPGTSVEWDLSLQSEWPRQRFRMRIRAVSGLPIKQARECY